MDFFDFSLFLGHIVSMKRFSSGVDYPILLAFFAFIALCLLGVLSFSTSMGLWVIGGLLLFILFCFFIDFGLFLTILALPIINWNIYLQGLIIPFSDLLGVVLLVAFFTRYLALKLFKTKQVRNLRWPFALPFFIFLAATFLSGLLSQSPLDSIWYVIRWILFSYLAFVVAPANLIITEGKLKKAILALVISTSVIAAMGATSLIGQDWHHSFLRIKPVQILNIYPIGENQNLLAEFLVIGVFFALALRYLVKRTETRRLLNLTTIFLTIVAILTFSRAAWIVLVIQGLFFIWHQSRRLRQKYIMFALISMIFLAPLTVYMVALQSNYNISSTENRVLLSQIALEAFFEKPIFGYGTGEFVNLVERSIRFRAQYGEPLDSHGVWQKILAENGSIGVIAFAFLLASLFSTFWQTITELYRKGQDTYFLPLVVAVSGGIIFQFFNTSYYKGKVWLPVGIVIAAWYLIKQRLYERAKEN